MADGPWKEWYRPEPPPLSQEEREERHALGVSERYTIDRYEATVQAAEQRAQRYEAALREIEALPTLTGAFWSIARAALAAEEAP